MYTAFSDPQLKHNHSAFKFALYLCALTRRFAPYIAWPASAQNVDNMSKKPPIFYPVCKNWNQERLITKRKRDSSGINVVRQVDACHKIHTFPKHFVITPPPPPPPVAKFRVTSEYSFFLSPIIFYKFILGWLNCAAWKPRYVQNWNALSSFKFNR